MSDLTLIESGRMPHTSGAGPSPLLMSMAVARALMCRPSVTLGLPEEFGIETSYDLPFVEYVGSGNYAGVFPRYQLSADGWLFVVEYKARGTFPETYGWYAEAAEQPPGEGFGAAWQDDLASRPFHCADSIAMTGTNGVWTLEF